MDKKALEALMRERARVQGLETRQYQLADAAEKRAEAERLRCPPQPKNRKPRS